MSRGFQLVTRERPVARAFLRAVRDAAGGVDDIMMDGDFNDPNGNLNVLGYGLEFEIEPPGHVDAADLSEEQDGGPGETALPEPDSEGCLWLTTARIPAGAPAISADVAWRAFQRLAFRYNGVALPE